MLRVLSLCAFVCHLMVGTAFAQSATLQLAWDPSPDVDVTGYRVLFGTAPGTYTSSADAGKTTEYTLEGLEYGRQYYLAVQAYNAAGETSPPSTEIQGATPAVAPSIPGTLLLGLGAHPNSGGWVATRSALRSADPMTWVRLPWESYNATGGGVRMAAGDLDGDSGDELVLGLGAGSGGWVAILDDAAHGHALLKWIRVAWSQYTTANGEVFPAVGDIDGDGRGEIVLGLGQGGGGWYQIFDDATTDFKHLTWRKVPWAAYNTANGETHPAVGDLDGNGTAEIVLGLGRNSNGWMLKVTGATTSAPVDEWLRITWDGYAKANGTTFPAVGNLDADPGAELVVGLGQGSAGWFQVFDDAASGLKPLKWDSVAWEAYAAANGETHPAIGNVDTDAQMEIVFGLGQFGTEGGWFAVKDDLLNNLMLRGWGNVGWDAFAASGGALFPAIAR